MSMMKKRLLMTALLLSSAGDSMLGMSRTVRGGQLRGVDFPMKRVACG